MFKGSILVQFFDSRCAHTLLPSEVLYYVQNKNKNLPYNPSPVLHLEVFGRCSGAIETCMMQTQRQDAACRGGVRLRATVSRVLDRVGVDA